MTFCSPQAKDSLSRWIDVINITLSVQVIDDNGIARITPQAFSSSPQRLLCLLALSDVFDRCKVTDYIALFVLDPGGTDDY